MVTFSVDRTSRPQAASHKTKAAPAEFGAPDLFAPNSNGTLETLSDRSKITGFHAGAKLASNMRAGVVTIESPAICQNGHLELSQILAFPKAVLVVDGRRQELWLEKLPRQGDWDYGGFQAELPNGKQLEIRSCMTYCEPFQKRYGVEMKVSDPGADTGVTLAFRDQRIARNLNGQTEEPAWAIAEHGKNSVTYAKGDKGSSGLTIQSENLSASPWGAVEEVVTEFKNGRTISRDKTDKFPEEQVAAVKSEVTSALDSAFGTELKGGMLLQTSSTSPILMAIYGNG